MIQRIQTVYMALAVIFTVVCLWLPVGLFNAEGLTVIREYNLFIVDSANVRQFGVWPMFAVLVPSAALGVYSIFTYSNRIVQSRFCMFNILLLVGWYILYAVFSRVFGVGEGTVTFRPTVYAAFPGVALILYMMARRAIKADEALVRAADRIR